MATLQDIKRVASATQLRKVGLAKNAEEVKMCLMNSLEQQSGLKQRAELDI